MLIQIDTNLIVNDSEISKVVRMGNYTEVHLKSDPDWKWHSQWDDKKELWSKIQKATQND
jgi:hypothetical protein